MSAVTVCAAAIVASVLGMFLRKNNTEYSIILTVCAASILITYIAGALIEAVSGIKEIFDQSGMSESYIVLLMKCVGLCFLTEFTCDTCKDAGQAALSSVVLFGGRISVLITALPLFSQLINTVTELSGG